MEQPAPARSDAFGAVTTHNLAHTPYAHRRSVLEEIEARFPEAVAATARSPFRSDDRRVAAELARPALRPADRHGVRRPRPTHAYVNISNSRRRAPAAPGCCERDQDFICLADHHDHALGADRLARVLEEFLEEFLPVPAPWER